MSSAFSLRLLMQMFAMIPFSHRMPHRRLQSNPASALRKSPSIWIWDFQGHRTCHRCPFLCYASHGVRLISERTWQSEVLVCQVEGVGWLPLLPALVSDFFTATECYCVAPVQIHAGYVQPIAMPVKQTHMDFHSPDLFHCCSGDTRYHSPAPCH